MPADKSVPPFVMAVGERSCRHPHTANRCKPALPFNEIENGIINRSGVPTSSPRRLELLA